MSRIYPTLPSYHLSQPHTYLVSPVFLIWFISCLYSKIVCCFSVFKIDASNLPCESLTDGHRPSQHFWPWISRRQESRIKNALTSGPDPRVEVYDYRLVTAAAMAYNLAKGGLCQSVWFSAFSKNMCFCLCVHDFRILPFSYSFVRAWECELDGNSEDSVNNSY